MLRNEPAAPVAQTEVAHVHSVNKLATGEQGHWAACSLFPAVLDSMSYDVIIFTADTDQ